MSESAQDARDASAAHDAPATQRMAKALGVSQEAVAATYQAGLVDLHIDTFIPVRMWGYDVAERHGVGNLRGRFGGHLDFPRMADGGVSGAMWSVTTNPFRFRGGRWRTAVKNFKRLRALLEAQGPAVRIVTTLREHLAAREVGAHSAMLAIQGGNALDGAVDGDIRPDPALLRVTLVHLSSSEVGESSQPMQVRHETGLTAHGRELVARLNQKRVFVDLAHIAPQGFWDAVEVHDRSLPILVTHTGVTGVTPHWRNLDDDQLRAVAATGGTIGIMFHTKFLARPGPRDCSMVIDHMQHVIDTVGEDFVSIGSDYDGAITPPADLRSGDSYPRLVQCMLDRNWSTGRIEKVLSKNFERAFGQLRP